MGFLLVKVKRDREEDELKQYFDNLLRDHILMISIIEGVQLVICALNDY